MLAQKMREIASKAFYEDFETTRDKVVNYIDEQAHKGKFAGCFYFLKSQEKNIAPVIKYLKDQGFLAAKLQNDDGGDDGIQIFWE